MREESSNNLNKKFKKEVGEFPFVSVIIPIYNAEKFLGETIDSVQNQTLKNIEIILVNDGSADKSKEICEEKAKNDSRIVYLEQGNQGVSIARNNGLLKASGDYIYFMDADDTIDEDFLSFTYTITQESKNDVVVIGEYFCKRLTKVAAFPTWALLISHDFLRNHNDVRFPEGIQPCEDGLFSHKLFALTKNIGANPRSVYHYRKHDNQNHVTINANTSKVIEQIPQWFKILEEFYTNNNLFETHIHHLALFMEHEPFEFRYLKMPFDESQKEFLHNLIKKFMYDRVLPSLKKDEMISKNFRRFLECDNFYEFDSYYKTYLKQQEHKRKLLILLSKVIPLSNYRRKVRDMINEKYA
ncbi:glycosyltransferase family 2 protein [Tenacibaculum xiamenense]|uniref:glycosyltransferase family 2 protein n=1 Tax=Tenacibaculum xiamenense TaxID=1261553 RepID=UPI003893A7AB